MATQRKDSVSKETLMASVRNHIKTRPDDANPGKFLKYLDTKAMAVELDMEPDSLTTRLSTLRSKLHKIAIAKFTEQYKETNGGAEPTGDALKAIITRADNATIPQALRGGGTGRPVGDKSVEYSFIDFMSGEQSDDPNPSNDVEDDASESDLPASQG